METKTLDGYTPVSYTHLDVYKRQTYDEESGLELHDVLEQAGDEGVDLEAMEEGEIDVYKRQQLGRLKDKRADLSENRGDSRRNQTGGSKKPKQKMCIRDRH